MQPRGSQSRCEGTSWQRLCNTSRCNVTWTSTQKNTDRKLRRHCVSQSTRSPIVNTTLLDFRPRAAHVRPRWRMAAIAIPGALAVSHLDRPPAPQSSGQARHLSPLRGTGPKPDYRPVLDPVSRTANRHCGYRDVPGAIGLHVDRRQGRGEPERSSDRVRSAGRLARGR